MDATPGGAAGDIGSGNGGELVGDGTAGQPDPDAPQVTFAMADGVATLTVVGELTELARRPLVRAVTDLLLSGVPVKAVHLVLREVAFMNSAGSAVLVQLQRLGAPRGVDVVLVEPPDVVARPLQLTGLWTRFRIVGAAAGS